ncbi:hypothetical protein J421_5975 (plasmid) [Gemmatirosa kalamazoonensis]|uniref:Uncharacterized protein n=2 Tax=Gemmatirosa kalamazoonensis TaxID=861299 RepID=W0RT61_9BACT|nr:hypothetical protein J421_5975 [Gemmatirosa kalamazoonensis]
MTSEPDEAERLPDRAEGSTVARGQRPERARAAALDDRALLAAMQGGDEWAWSEFHARFRPLLAGIARHVRMPVGADVTAAEALVDEVLADEAVRLTQPGAPRVMNLAGYLVRAARHKLIDVRRAAARRQRRYAEAATDATRHAPVRGTVRGTAGPAHVGEAVVETLCSEYARRASEPREPNDDAAGSPAVRALAAAIRDMTSDDERLLLTWLAERVSHRMIATWLGVSYDAATKRIWRLCRKLRAAAVQYGARLGDAERAEVDRFLRRAGVLPPVVASVSPAAAARDCPTTPFDDER